VMTAAQACAALLTTRLDPGAKVLVVGGKGLVTAVRAAGFEVVGSADEEPDAVAQGYAPEVGWTQLAEAAYAVGRGAWHVASNLDLSLPTARGFAPGNGALVGAVRAATGVVPDSAGKPSPTMYRLAVERAAASRPLVIGDRLDTDLAGARGGGYPGLHVLNREEHTSELQSRENLVCRLLLEKKKTRSCTKRERHHTHRRTS